MGQTSGTYDSYDLVGVREDLSDIITNIAPMDTPVMSAIGRETATNVYHEWQTDTLAAAVSTNYVIEGDEATIDSGVATTRVGNRLQISDKAIIVSGTARAVKSAGRGDELSYQQAKRGEELKRDMETSLCGNVASVTGDSSTARRLGGFETWITTNDSRSGTQGGFSGGNTAAASDGTQRAFTESQLKTVLQSMWDNGANPGNCMLVVGSFNNGVFSGFTGVASPQSNAANKAIVASASVYESDFGTVRAVPSRFSRSRSALVIDPEYLAMASLPGRLFMSHPLSKLGDADRWQILSEYTLVVKTELAHGIIADLTTA